MRNVSWQLRKTMNKITEKRVIIILTKITIIKLTAIKTKCDSSKHKVERLIITVK